jgi:hypothetical protein
MSNVTPIRGDVLQDQPDQLGRGFVAWEVTAGLHNLAHRAFMRSMALVV